MIFSIDQAEIDARFRGVRTLLSFIKSGESTEMPPVDSDEVKILRGLFYAHLYGAFEWSVNDAVQKYLRGLSLLKIESAHTAFRFWPAALDGKFKALQTTYGTGNWRKRVAFIDAIESLDECAINDALFSEHLQNAWPDTVELVLRYLGLTPPNWNSADVLYLREVVDKRNQVSHGRTDPIRVGSGGRSDDLEYRLLAVKAILDSFVLALESQFPTFTYIKPEFHEIYSARLAAV